MKVLEIYGNFKLPDDFKGTLSDALREFATFMEDDSKPTIIVEKGGMKKGVKSKFYKKSWASFEDAVKRGFRFNGSRRLMHCDKNDKWTYGQEIK